MANLEITTVYAGKRARCKLASDDGKVLHNTLYRNINAAIWWGMWWGRMVQEHIRWVIVDGEEIRQREVADRLWAYIDGRPDGDG